MIADLDAGELKGDNGSIIINEDLLDRIKFIKEGDFKEAESATALRLIGGVQSIAPGTVTVRKAFVTPGDLIDDFLSQETPYEARDYIRCAVEAHGFPCIILQGKLD